MNHSGIPADRWNPRVQAQIAAQMEQDAAKRGAKLQTIPTSPPEPQKPATAIPAGKVRLVAFDLPYPPSINTYWRSLVINGRVRVLISSKGRKFKKQAADIAWRHIKTPMDGPVAVVLMVYRPRRIGDLDNVIKATLDGLKGVVFHDDNQVVRITAERHDDKAFPRIGVRVMIHP